MDVLHSCKTKEQIKEDHIIYILYTHYIYFNPYH